MAKISKKEAKVLLKDHEKWAKYSWIDDICEYAISDMEKLDRIENTRPIDLINEFGDLEAEKFNKISHWFSQAQKLEKIEQTLKCNDGKCKKTKDECFNCMDDKLDCIEQIVKE